MTRIDWRKARQFKASEVKYEHLTKFDDGTVVVKAPQDAMEVRARKAEAEWRRRMRLDPKLRRE